MKRICRPIVLLLLVCLICMMCPAALAEDVSHSSAQAYLYCTGTISNTETVTNIFTGNYSLVEYRYTGMRDGIEMDPWYATHKCVEWKYKKGASVPYDIVTHCPYGGGSVEIRND